MNSPKQTQNTANHKMNTEESWAELANRFQALGIEELPDKDDLDVSNYQGGLNIVFELEEESEEMKMSLMIFCFFEDLHRTQEFLHEVWKCGLSDG